MRRLLVLTVLCSAASAQDITVLPPTRNVDFYQGPIVSSHRVIGLGAPTPASRTAGTATS